MILKIKGYTSDNNTIESHFLFVIEYDNNNIQYKLIIPTNPLIECDLLKLHLQDINKVRKVLIKLITKKEYSCKTTDKLLLFLNWINNINNVSVVLQ